MIKRIMMVVLVMSLALIFVPQSSARVCVAKVGGSCVLWSGSLTCEIGGIGLGNCDDVYLGCTIEGSGNWVVACGAPGNENPSPGINIFYFDGGIAEGTVELVPGDCTANGTAVVEVTASVDQTIKDALLAAGACPNPNWVVLDAVPQYATVTDKQYDENLCVVADATLECELPNPETLAWVYDADTDSYAFEKRQYNCTVEGTNTYKTPVCP